MIPEDKERRHDPVHQHFLFEGMDFPATKEDLVDFATEASNAASDTDTLNLIRALPDRDYLNKEDVWRAVGEATRVLANGGRKIGAPRDDIGKQITDNGNGFQHP
jgi:hypothetical protein